MRNSEPEESGADEAVLNGGAQSFVVGRDTRCADHLRSSGIGCSEALRLRPDMSFWQPPDDEMHDSDKIYRKPRMFVHVTVFYGRRKLQWDDSSWTRVH